MAPFGRPEIPISLRFKISKQDFIFESEKEEWHIVSEEFKIQEFPGVSYCVGICSKIFKDHEIFSGKCLFLFMGLKSDAKLNMNVDYKLSIPTANYIDNYEPNKKGMYVTYWNYIGQTDELFDQTRNFIVNDYLVITIKAILSVQKEEAEGTGSDSKNLLECCFSKLGIGDSAIQLWKSDDKDLDFVVKEKEIKVHKCVIATKSPVFDRMIKSGLEESTENKVLITDFDFDIVEIGIKFCYQMKEKNLWTVEIATKLLQFSDKYDIKDLKILMENFLSPKVSCLNVCKIANASILGNSIKLRQQCFEYLFECNQKKIFVRDIKLLDKDFAVELMEASFSRIVSAEE